MLSTAHNTKPFNLDSFRSSMKPRRAINCVLGSLSIVCICVIAVVAVIVVREYCLSEDYERALCRLLNATFADQDGQCLYCSGSVDKSKERRVDHCTTTNFPCLHVTVTFQVAGRSHRGLLYADTNQATGSHSQCSFSVCHKTRPENARAVEEFADGLESHGNASFPCYYDKKTMDNAILEKVYSKMDVFHYLFWPSLVIFICGLVFLYSECHRKGVVLCPPDKKDPFATQNSAPRTHAHMAETGSGHAWGHSARHL